MVIACVLKNWLGDVVFSTPAIRALRYHFPLATIVCLAPKRCVPILEANPYVDQVMVFDERHEHRGWLAKLKLISDLKRLKIDRAYLFHRSFTRALLLTLGGAKNRIGYLHKWRQFLLTQAYQEPEGVHHAVDVSLELLRQSGLAVTGDALYEFYFNKNDLEEVKSLLKRTSFKAGRLVAVNPGANWPPKRWPVEHFAELVQELTTRFQVNVIITGGEADQPLADIILRANDSERVVSICGQSSLRQLGALFSLCSLVISSDSGPLHIAGGVGTNVIGIFGPTDPVRTGPRGRGKNIIIHYVPEGQTVPWYGENFPGKGWMDRISAAEVMAAIEKEKLL